MKMKKKTLVMFFGIDVDGNVLDKKIMYGSLKFHQDHDYIIIEFKDIDFSEKLDWTK